ncbi:MAG: tetratricopeptide repeat protein [Candidatus Heimdallarchaeota archaeon]|nr:tetratricopeptide repeat protein [Candidatus Heimdallarchaeota archaeon]
MPKAKISEEAKINFLKGKELFEKGLIDEAIFHLKKAVRHYQYTSEYPVLAEIQRMLGQLAFDKGKMLDSRAFFRKAYSSFKRFGNKIAMADCYDKIAVSFMVQSEYRHAENYQKKAIDIRKETPDKKGLVRALKNLAAIKYSINERNSDEALELLEEAMRIARKANAPQLLIKLSLDQVKIYTKLKDYSSALKAMVTARRVSKEQSIALPEDNDQEFGELLLNVGLQHYDEGDFKTSLKYLKNASLILKNDEKVELLVQKLQKHLREH